MTGGYGAANGSSAGGYLPPVDNGAARFTSETSASSYQSLPPVADGYRSDLPASGYHAAGYETSAGYESTTSYSSPVSQGYGASERTADYSGGYQPSGYQPGDYQGYGGSASSSGSHRRPEPGYLPGSYPSGAELSTPAALPPAQPDPGYPIYSAPVPTGQNGYPPAGPQVPGYGAAPYQHGGYEPGRV